MNAAGENKNVNSLADEYQTLKAGDDASMGGYHTLEREEGADDIKMGYHTLYIYEGRQ